MMVKTEDHFVGATWDSGDQMPRFIAEEILGSYRRPAGASPAHLPGQ
jgi:hypothetical protein